MSASLSHSSYNQAPNRMALTHGTRLGPYAVTAPLSLGEMGEVYWRSFFGKSWGFVGRLSSTSVNRIVCELRHRL